MDESGGSGKGLINIFFCTDFEHLSVVVFFIYVLCGFFRIFDWFSESYPFFFFFVFLIFTSGKNPPCEFML